jgi:hypothetical protein
MFEIGNLGDRMCLSKKLPIMSPFLVTLSNHVVTMDIQSRPIGKKLPNLDALVAL